MNHDAIVITGVGVMSPLGLTLAALWQRLVAGDSAVREWPDLSDYRCARACRIDDAASGFHPAPLRRGRALAIAAAEQAVAQAWGPGAGALPAGTGVYIGSTLGESVAFECAAEGEALALADFRVPSFTRGVREHFALDGPQQSLATACAAGNFAVGAAMSALRAGRVPAALAGGVEPFSRLSLVGFSRSRAMASDRCRPFDHRRSGMLLGEGAAVFVLERAAHALGRGAVPLAEVVSLGLSCDAYHPTAPLPDGSGMARAMQQALDAAGIAAADVDWVNAHGSGTRASDAAEAKALHTVFGTRMPLVSGSKGALGHALGASSALESAICLEGLRTGTVPPTAGHDEPDPDGGMACTRTARQQPMRWVLNNAFAFGGVNSALLLRAWEG
jgi:3-oxoacyl-[acyl-carrier-protein] synthase II